MGKTFKDSKQVREKRGPKTGHRKSEHLLGKGGLKNLKQQIEEDQ